MGSDAQLYHITAVPRILHIPLKRVVIYSCSTQKPPLGRVLLYSYSRTQYPSRRVLMHCYITPKLPHDQSRHYISNSSWYRIGISVAKFLPPIVVSKQRIVGFRMPLKLVRKHLAHTKQLRWASMKYFEISPKRRGQKMLFDWNDAFPEYTIWTIESSRRYLSGISTRTATREVSAPRHHEGLTNTLLKPPLHHHNMILYASWEPLNLPPKIPRDQMGKFPVHRYSEGIRRGTVINMDMIQPLSHRVWMQYAPANRTRSIDYLPSDVCAAYICIYSDVHAVLFT